MESLQFDHCIMTLSFDINKFVAALPGGLCFGYVSVKNQSYRFTARKHIYVPERHLGDFMKILQSLSKNIVTLEDREKECETSTWADTIITLNSNKLQRQIKNQFDFSFDINLTTFLAFLIALRKVSYWMIGPTKTEFEMLDFFVRHLKNKLVEFPKTGEVEEDIKIVLEEHELTDETKFFLNHFIQNHYSLIEFQYNLFCLTTKK